MIYVCMDAGAFPILLVKAKNKKEARDKASLFYKEINSEILKKEIYVNKLNDYFEETEILDTESMR